MQKCSNTVKLVILLLRLLIIDKRAKVSYSQLCLDLSLTLDRPVPASVSFYGPLRAPDSPAPPKLTAHLLSCCSS